MDRLKAHQEYLAALQEYHQGWTQDAEEVEVGRLHGEIPDLIKQTIDRCDHLLNVLQTKMDKV